MTFAKIRNSAQGFTLIEVMVVVALIGILAAIAIPSYTEYIRRSNRAEARNYLQALSQRLELNYGQSFTYNTTKDNTAINASFISTAGMSQVPAGGSARYNISFVAGEPTASTFVLQAVPVGAQIGDKCGTLLLNQQNLKGANNVLDNRAALTLECWNR